MSLFVLYPTQPVEAVKKSLSKMMQIYVRNHWSWVFSIDSSLVALLQQPCSDESFRKVEIRIDLEKRCKGYNARNLFFGMMSV